MQFKAFIFCTLAFFFLLSTHSYKLQFFYISWRRHEHAKQTWVAIALLFFVAGWSLSLSQCVHAAKITTELISGCRYGLFCVLAVLCCVLHVCMQNAKLRGGKNNRWAERYLCWAFNNGGGREAVCVATWRKVKFELISALHSYRISLFFRLTLYVLHIYVYDSFMLDFCRVSMIASVSWLLAALQFSD